MKTLCLHICFQHVIFPLNWISFLTFSDLSDLKFPFLCVCVNSKTD